MAGTIPLSLTQQIDKDSLLPLRGGKLYLYQAGTTSTPQNAYQDSALTLVLPNPIVLDSAGRLPQFFLADGSIKVRLDNSAGVNQFTQDGILVVGASSGGGGGSPVDPTTIIQTGWIQPIYGTGVVTGFVRTNGRTIGNAISGGTERANADTSALFSFLYTQDVNLAVSGGRGANAAADYAANKTITLPDWRGMALAGLDDMGNSSRGVFTGATFGSGNATTLGSFIGAARRTILKTNLPSLSHSHGLNALPGNKIDTLTNTPGTGGDSAVRALNAQSNTTDPFDPGGSSAPMDTISPYTLCTIYLKL